jgi:choline dehydrogenase-like flavoprotein
MQVTDLSSFDPNSLFETDLVIVGGGPAGLTIARELFSTSIRVLVLESGQTQEQARFSDLNRLESVGEPRRDADTIKKRSEFHGASSKSWTDESQPYGVRSRVLGGSSQVWAGKSATFDGIDFEHRDWVPNSGWPFSRAKLAPYEDRAAEVLNFGPNCYDEKFWNLLGVAPPTPAFDQARLRSFFWQFARSRTDRMDVMRFGSEFLSFDAPNVRVLLNATVTHIDVNEAGSAFDGLEISTIDGVRSRVKAKAAVLAAGGIENPRLLLASRRRFASGVGNHHDVVGRFLMDHPGMSLGRFRLADVHPIIKRFGFYGLRRQGRVNMYVHGLAMGETTQRREGLLNCAAYIMEERAPDDPWDALKRLLRGKSETVLSDVMAVAASPNLLIKGIGLRAFQSDAIPRALTDPVINMLIARLPRFVVREYQNRGLPHKLTGLSVDAITEQVPEHANRISLADKTDALGAPIACADWRVGDLERRSFERLGQLMVEELSRAGLPAPVLEDCILEGRVQDAVVIDMCHSSGTTRISDNPKSGVVDQNCRVHGIAGLYVAGASVFPTSGHANPTLMLLGLAIRLADHLKTEFAVSVRECTIRSRAGRRLAEESVQSLTASGLNKELNGETDIARRGDSRSLKDISIESTERIIDQLDNASDAAQELIAQFRS